MQNLASPILAAQKADWPDRKFYKLDRIQKACEQLQHPERSSPVILVAGTNGKGSVVSLISHLLIQAGYKVGSSFSPHVLHRGERMQIDMRPSSEREIEYFENQYQSVLSELTYFERMTLLGFLIFQHQKVDVQVIEVGMGGRLDATNVSDPVISVVTQIDWDHQNVLGDSLEKIAFEKCGILRSGKAFVHGAETRDSVREVFEQQALKRGSESFDASRLRWEEDIEKMLESVGYEHGHHQISNCRVAFQAFELFSGQSLDRMERDALQNLLSRSFLNGRTQIWKSSPLWILDGCHNPSAALALSEWLRTRFPDQVFHCIFGLMSDKSTNEILRPLLPWVKDFHLTSFYPEREKRPDELANEIPVLSSKAVHQHHELSSLLKQLQKERENVLVTGSFYLVGKVLQILEPVGADHE